MSATRLPVPLLPDGSPMIESRLQGVDADSISQNTGVQKQKKVFHPGTIKNTALPDTEPQGSIRK